jgi:hypothetical protein
LFQGRRCARSAGRRELRQINAAGLAQAEKEARFARRRTRRRGGPRAATMSEIGEQKSAGAAEPDIGI